jgi:hypothetical protein
MVNSKSGLSFNNYLINSNEEFHVDIYEIIDIITHGINEYLEL